MISRVMIVGILGPAIALFATWYEAVKITQIGASGDVATSIVQKLRNTPNEAVLREIRDMASGIRGFRSLDSETIVAAAEKLFSGWYEVNNESREVSVPFDPTDWPSDDATWNLRYCSLIVPALLARAYEVSLDYKYIRAAVDYIIDWSEFESSLLLPRDAIFNDHAIAARAVVVTHAWHLYRSSETFSTEKAVKLLSYVQKLSRLLQTDGLYQYETNHGLMQNKSLLHLAIAFPYLDEAEQNIEIGTNRLLELLQYFINPEGVIQEHSPGYHHQFVEAISAAWRYFALIGRPVPPELAKRYERALEFDAAMLRPDGTLPPMGDTRDLQFSPARAVSLNEELVASTALEEPRRAFQKPRSSIIAPAAGYAIVWSGLENWPLMSNLSQTVLSWTNFPAKAHKHDDELSISIWSDGTQWVRGVGYWPYIPSRSLAVGWRSSNGPHWMEEKSSDKRSSSLAGMITNEQISGFDVVRTNFDASSIRRQLFVVENDTWVVLDSFESQQSGEGEIIWRFSPGLILTPIAPHAYSLRAPDSPSLMTISFNFSSESTVDADHTGDANWNFGVATKDGIVRSPAIRVSSKGNHFVFGTIFRLQDNNHEETAYPTRRLDWQSPESWQVAIAPNGSEELAIERNSNLINLDNASDSKSEWVISTDYQESASDNRQITLDAFEEATRRYGRPFRPALELRSRVTSAILVIAMLQFIFLIFVELRYRTYWRTIFVANSLLWIAISAYIGTTVVI